MLSLEACRRVSVTPLSVQPSFEHPTNCSGDGVSRGNKPSAIVTALDGTTLPRGLSSCSSPPVATSPAPSAADDRGLAKPAENLPGRSSPPVAAARACDRRLASRRYSSACCFVSRVAHSRWFESLGREVLCGTPYQLLLFFSLHGDTDSGMKHTVKNGCLLVIPENRTATNKVLDEFTHAVFGIASRREYS